GAGSHGRYLDVIMTEELDNTRALQLVILHHEQALRMRRGKTLDALEGSLDAVRGHGLHHVCERTMRQPVLTFLLERDDLHRDMPRQRIELQVVEDGPAQHVGQEDIERNRRGKILTG